MELMHIPMPPRLSLGGRCELLPRCAIAFLIVFFGGIGLIFAFLLVVDPYDTGRFPTPLPTGVVDIERRTATVSRGRDPRFNAAIFGNSRTFKLDPSSPRPPD